MSQMLTNTRRIVNEDVSIRINQFDVICEAITNSIHSNSTEINCILQSNDKIFQNEGKDFVSPKVDKIIVTDNGDGFNQKNYESFCKYRTGYKKDLGCKGVGRFIFLKVFKNVEYVSNLVDLQEEITFKFDLDFDTDNIKKKNAKCEHNLTKISLSSLTSLYLNLTRHIDRRIELILQNIREKVLLNLVPTLFFYKKKGVEIIIQFTNSSTNEKLFIKHSDIPDFTKKEFLVEDINGYKHSFKLNYRIEKTKGKLHAYHCAGNRTVCEFSDKDFKMSLPYGYSGFLLLESDFLNKHINHERNDFDIFPIKTDLFSTISWETINTSLKSILSEIVKKSIPETAKINKSKLVDIQEQRPYLTDYIEEEDIEMAGFLDKRQLIEKAKKRFDLAKESVLSDSGKESYSDEELNNAIQITQNELVSYIYDRALVIERLKSMITNNEKVESIIHNLFMKKYTDDDYFCIGKNNLWLLDDRYTSYSYAASDKRIKDILEEINEEYDEVVNVEDRPDLSLFFSHNPSNHNSLKSVLIELKPFDYKSKSDRKKFQGIQQLVDYVEAFKNKENIEEIWAFLITDVDEKLSKRLRKDDYVPLFSTHTPIYHRFYKELGISIYVISAKTLISDAEARNKVFLDIIKKQSKLSKLLKSK